MKWRACVGVAAGVLAAVRVAAEPFALVHRERAPGLAPAGALGDLLLLARNGDSIDAVDPSTGAVVRQFLRPPSIAALGPATVVVGAELWVGAPTADADRGAVVVFDAATGAVLRTVRPDVAFPNEVAFGRALAATATRVAVGAPFSDRWGRLGARRRRRDGDARRSPLG